MGKVLGLITWKLETAGPGTIYSKRKAITALFPYAVRRDGPNGLLPDTDIRGIWPGKLKTRYPHSEDGATPGIRTCRSFWNERDITGART